MRLWNEVKKLSGGQIAVITLIVSPIIALITFFVTNWWQTPSALIGWIEDPPGAVLVIRDNGAALQHADDITGWFRFEDVRRGQHHLRFEYDEYHPLPVTMRVTGPGDNYLSPIIQLTSLAASVTPPVPQMMETVFVPRYTKDGTPPRMDIEILYNSIMQTAEYAAGDNSWVYLGSSNERELAFQELNFNQIRQLAGRSIESQAPVLIWNGAPEKAIFRGFQLGMVEGIVDSGTKLTFSDTVTEVGQGHYWARVQSDRE